MTTTMNYTAEQAGRLALQYIATHGNEEWEQCFWNGSALVVPDELVTKVQALDPDKLPVPNSVTPFQARAVLIDAGLLAGVEATLAADTSPQGLKNKAAWEYGISVERSSALISGIGSSLGLSVAQIDQMFRDAAVVTA